MCVYVCTYVHAHIDMFVCMIMCTCFQGGRCFSALHEAVDNENEPVVCKLLEDGKININSQDKVYYRLSAIIYLFIYLFP